MTLFKVPEMVPVPTVILDCKSETDLPNIVFPEASGSTSRLMRKKLLLHQEEEDMLLLLLYHKVLLQALQVSQHQPLLNQ